MFKNTLFKNLKSNIPHFNNSKLRRSDNQGRTLVNSLLNLNFMINVEINKISDIASKTINNFISDIQNDPVIVPVILTVASAAVIATAATATWRYFYPTSTANTANTTNTDVEINTEIIKNTDNVTNVTNTVNEVNSSAPAIVDTTNLSDLTITIPRKVVRLFNHETLENTRDKLNESLAQVNSAYGSISDLPFVKKLSNEIVPFISGSRPNNEELPIMVDSINAAIARKEIPGMSIGDIATALNNVCKYRQAQRCETQTNKYLAEIDRLLQDTPVLDSSPTTLLFKQESIDLSPYLDLDIPFNIADYEAGLGMENTLTWIDFAIKLYDNIIGISKIVWTFFFGS